MNYLRILFTSLWVSVVCLSGTSKASSRMPSILGPPNIPIKTQFPTVTYMPYPHNITMSKD